MNRSREEQTALALMRMYEQFIEHLEVLRSSVFVNPVVLLDASKRYWRDVDRLHKFHDMPLIDCHKIAGYLTYWIVKFKPISVVKVGAYTPSYNELLLNMNEYFAFYVAIGRIYDLDKTGRKIAVSRDFVESFVYTLKNRLTTGDNLTIIYQLINGMRA